MTCRECGHQNPTANLTCDSCETNLYLAKLRIILDSGRHQENYLFSQDYKLGRGEENEITIADPSVSRFHAEIKFKNGLFSIIDNGSKNGSLLNNSHFENHELHDQDCIQIGNISMHFYEENGKNTLDKLRTEEFVQQAFFKFTKNRRTEITTNDVLKTMLDLAVSLIHAEKGFLFEYGETSKPKFRFGTNAKAELIYEKSLTRPDWKVVDDVIRFREMKITPKSAHNKSGNSSGWLRIAFPLVAAKSEEAKNNGAKNDSVLGVCFFSNEKKGKPISENKQELLNVLIHQISIAMENQMLASEAREKRRLSEQLEAARKTQQKLFPGINAKSETLKVATYAAPSETISGDYFDIIPVSESTIAIAIGDICGKGLPAALLTSTVQAAINSQLEYSKSPVEIIHNLNRLLIKSTADSIFLTLFFGILDIESGILKYINAGHPPPILVKKDNSIEELSATTFALGIFEPEIDRESAIKFEARDILIMYTDGVIENQNGNKKIYGRRRLLKLMQSLAATGNIRRRKLETTLAKVVEDLADFSGERKQEDDLTLVAIKRR